MDYGGVHRASRQERARSFKLQFLKPLELQILMSQPQWYAETYPMKLLVFSDLDETLLDGQTYSWEAATNALSALKERSAALVLVSSKTLPEMIPIHDSLGLDTPFIVENGGGIALIPSAPINSYLSPELFARGQRIGDRVLIPLGVQYNDLVAALDEISEETGITVRGFASMSDDEVAALTGLSVTDAAKARQRSFDEPFVIAEPTYEKGLRIEASAATRGITAVRGGRFWHLIGHKGKGKAVSIVIEAFRKCFGTIHTVGLGDGPNDFPFLALVDSPFLLGSAQKKFHIPEEINRARLILRPGPEGWHEAVTTLLSELENEFTSG